MSSSSSSSSGFKSSAPAGAAAAAIAATGGVGAAAAGVKRARDGKHDAEMRELRAKLAAAEAGAAEIAAAAEAAAKQAAAAAAAAAKQASAAAVDKATCCICLDIWECPVTAPGCGHAACKACFMEVASRNNECPTCRKELAALPAGAAAAHAATAQYPTAASKVIFDWPVSVALHELAESARAEELPPASPVEEQATTAARALRLFAAYAPRLVDVVWQVTTRAAANTMDSRGRSLLWWACATGWAVVTERFVSFGADVNAVDKYFKRSPLMEVLGFHKKIGLVKLLLDNGADVHARCSHGNAPLDVLRAWGDLDHDDNLAYLLLLADANVFKGLDPPAEWAPYIAKAVSRRAAAKVAAAAVPAAAPQLAGS
jgi:hypothetical protein